LDVIGHILFVLLIIQAIGLNVVSVIIACKQSKEKESNTE